jgi:FKBP-type peptidyl-prolyl cis-trans isomerase FklB
MGWREAMQLMSEGDKWQLFVPSELAYGESVAGREGGKKWKGA